MPNQPIRVLAVPYYGNQLCFFPVDEKEMGRLRKWLHKKMKDYGTKPQNKLRYKMYKWYKKRNDKEDASEKLLKRMPTDSYRLQIFHPSNISKAEVARQLLAQVQPHVTKDGLYALFFGIMLPVCVIIDIVTLGFFSLTASDLVSLGASWSKWRSSRRIRFSENTGYINYAPDARIQRYLDSAYPTHGVPTDESVIALSRGLGMPQLACTIFRLRNREMINRGIPFGAIPGVTDNTGAQLSLLPAAQLKQMQLQQQQVQQQQAVPQVVAPQQYGHQYQAGVAPTAYAAAPPTAYATSAAAPPTAYAASAALAHQQPLMVPVPNQGPTVAPAAIQQPIQQQYAPPVHVAAPHVDMQPPPYRPTVVSPTASGSQLALTPEQQQYIQNNIQQQLQRHLASQSMGYSTEGMQAAQRKVMTPTGASAPSYQEGIPPSLPHYAAAAT